MYSIVIKGRYRINESSLSHLHQIIDFNDRRWPLTRELYFVITKDLNFRFLVCGRLQTIEVAVLASSEVCIERAGHNRSMAEGVGFEPTRPFRA